MSVWKEDTYMLAEIEDKQDCYYGLIVKTNERQLQDTMRAHKPMVDSVRQFCKENMKSAKITKSDHYWKFELEMIEAIEDGRKIGAIAVIEFRERAGVECVEVRLFNPNKRF